VLYKLENSKWVDCKPTEASFKDITSSTRYDFLRTDPDGDYDVIIKRWRRPCGTDTKLTFNERPKSQKGE
jgi:ribosomal protein L32E